MANFGDILSSITLGSRQSVRRNFADTAFEAYETDNSLEFKVFNATGSTLTKGTVVYVNGVQGDKPTVAKADADLEGASSKTLGLVQHDIPNMEEGLVIEAGLLFGSDGDNFSTTGYTAGDLLWLSTTAGQFTATRPTQPAHGVFIGYVTRVHANAGAILVNIINGQELEELHDVLIASPVNKNVLAYDSTATLWKNAEPQLRVLEVFTTDANGTTSSEVDAYSYTVPANTLTVNGESLHAVYGGTKANTSPDVVTVNFAGTKIGDSEDITTAGDWRFEVDIVRTSNTAARATVLFTHNSVTKVKTTTVSTNLDFTTGEILKLTLYAEDVGTNITAKTGKVWKLRAA